MLFQLILFSLLLSSLFLLSGKIQTYIYHSVFIITKNRNFAIGILIVLLLPGTIIHELSHFLIATILRVPTGELTVIPTIEKSGPASPGQGGEVKAGKLYLAQTDPFRLSLIGLAPMIIGIVIIYFIGKTFFSDISIILNSKFLILNSIGLSLLFITSLTMFSSKKDLQAVIIAGPITLIVILVLYLAGLRVFLEDNFWQKMELILSDLNYYLVINTILNCLVFFILSVNLSLFQKILKRKINSK